MSDILGSVFRLCQLSEGFLHNTKGVTTDAGPHIRLANERLLRMAREAMESLEHVNSQCK
jgi:hypothetical protein